MNTQLVKHIACWNPYFINGKEVHEIIFFDNQTQTVIGKTKWFSKFGGNNDYPIVQLSHEITKTVRTIKLDSKIPFIHSIKGTIDVYIPIQTLDNYSIEIKNGSNDTTDYTETFLICDMLTTYRNVDATDTELKTHTIKTRVDYQSTPNKQSIEIDNQLNELKLIGITNISSRDLRTLLKHYILTKKI